jgi:predicted RNase H-like nuclease (RuvC/YqgF family)
MPHSIPTAEMASVPLEKTAATQTDVSASTSHGTSHQHIETLKQLDRRHKELRNIEESLQRYLEQLQNEEKSLRVALEQSSTSLKEQREREKSRKEEEAVARLEEALMGGSSSSDENEKDGGDEKEIDDGGMQANVDEDPEDWGDGKVVAV